MGFSEEYEKLRKKELEAEEKKTDSAAKTFSDAYNKLRQPTTKKKQQSDDEWSWDTARQKMVDRLKTHTITPGKKDTFFQAGAFEDGYDFGDVTRAILGTTSDAVDDLFTGAVGIVEPVIDAGAYIAGLGGRLFGADEFAQDMRKFVKDDLIDEEAVGSGLGWINPLKWGSELLGDVEEDSVLGTKSDALVQSGGQLAATVGLQAVHVPWWVTTGVTSFGSGVETAFKNDADYGVAGVVGAVNAGAEILTEKLFGGSGLGEKGIFNVDALTKGIADKAVKAMADFGIDMATEGFEEVASELMTNLASALYREEDLGSILASEEALEGYLDAFIGGAILSGTMNAGKVTNSVKAERDYRTGLSANEQKVFDSEYQKRLDEAGDIPKKEKAKLYDDVMEDLKKGYISTDRIQEVLGGETFDTYKDLYSKETEIRDEYEELKKSKKRTAEEQARYKELGEQIKMLDDSSFKNSLSEEVKRTQRFEADLSKYEGKQADVVKKAVESGILNNSGKTHEFVDMIARMSAEKSVDFDFTNNAKLRASGFAVDGATVNGYVTKDGVTLNVDSNKSWQFVVGHEITHVLEGTELYKGLQSAVAEYAKAKGDYQRRLDSIKNLYKDVKDADIDAEITADLVGEYLFSDEAFIRNLSAKNRNVFQKIYDEIKYLLNIATAGSKEARQLEKIKKMFETAYRESGAYVPPSSAIQYNLAAVESHKKKMQDVYSIQSSVELTDLLNRYDKIVEIWERLGGKLDSKFLNDWNEQKGKDRAFTVFKAQSGYKYNIELSSMCKKGVPLFEAIDKIITQEVMDQLNTDIIGKAEKEILYDILKNHDFEIPCAICYVEQARQREGAIINDFLNGREDIAKLGWNQTLARVQDEMNKNGVNYTFPSVDRSIATAKYMPADIAMDEATQTAFYSALQKIANEEIARYNAAENKNRPFVTDVTPEAIKKAFKGNISANLKIFRTLFSEPSSRFMIDRDLLYSSMTTRNLADAHNALYSVFNAQSGAAGYKTKQGTVVYWGDVLGKNWQASKLRNEGGARYQSNSDSQMYTLLDQAQMYMDFTAKGYYLQSYTKVLSHLKLFGLSRGKINASLIPSVYVYRNADGTVDIARTMENAGLDPDGELMFDDFEGINHVEAFMLIADPEYSKSVGGICIGYSDNHIFKMLDDPRIQLIIGFHDKTNNPEKRYAGARYAKNYNGENEAVNKDGKTVHVGFNKYVQKAEKMFAYDGKTESFSGQTTYNGKTYSANDIPRLASDIYLDDCESKGYTPAYNTFKDHSNYYKLLADFSLYDSNGQYAPHKKVAYEMPDKVPYLDENGAKQYMDTEKFIEVELAKEMKVRDSIAEALADDSENGIIPQFVKRVNEQAKKSLADSAERDASGTALSDLRYEGAEPITEDIAPTAEDAKETEESVASAEKEEPNVQADAEKTAAETEDARLEYEKASLLEELRQKKAEAQAIANDKNAYVSNKAKELYEELRNLKKGVRASKDLGYLLDHGFEWSALKAALTNIRYSPERKVNQNSVIEQIAREMLNDQYEDAVYRLDELDAEYEKKLADLEAKAGERRKQSAEASATGHVATVQERLEAKLSNAYEELSKVEKLRKASVDGYNAQIAEVQAEYDKKNNKNTKVANNLLVRIERLKRLRDDTDADYAKRVSDRQAKVEKLKAAVDKGYDEDVARETRAELQRAKVEEIETAFAQNGYDFQSVLKNAKNLSTWSTVDNTPPRVMEKSLGYKEGQILADETVNKVAQNESEGVKWLNSFTDRKNGLLAKISKQYHIKPGSIESAAAQMFAEGFYANDNGEYVKYGVEELEKDFPDANVRANIIGLAGDQRIRQIYDDTLKAINESRKRNGYQEIPRLENYFLHFRAMEDTFSTLGLPFNPNDIRAKDLPTDLNGVTADLKPGQPYFASAMHRRGIKTTHDLLGGLERYLSSAKNQIYHIDDIQTFRALRNFIANMYGQANGLDNLDELSEAEQKERIEEVFGSHLSTFAKFLHEEANILAGKTALIDRGLEGIIGRRGITFIDSLNKQVGANMVGFNASSALTNLVSGIQAIAKTDKASAVKAFSQTAASKFGAIFGKENTFAENDPFLIRRKGAERFHRKWFQKFADAGYVLASAVDDVTSEFIVRAKYNEYIKKGMNQQEALEKADKWSARLLGDRSLGQMPQIYNSKMLGLLTKFQLEVRNQLDSQFYDTIQEAKEDAKGVEEGLKRNAKIAANVTKTLFELAVLQHAFGTAFEAVAGYNPAFDIISVLATMFGFDDDDDSEDTVIDNVGQGFYELLEDMPYTSTFLGGGRIPVAEAFPNVEELLLGVDENGNEKSRLETLAEVAPYYVFPGGYGQLKKTVKGLSMFDDDLPVPGSYTDSGNLRFPVEDTFVNRLQAGIFGQWANENAREYIENERKPLNEKQIQEYIDADMSIFEYWEYLDKLKDFSTLAEKADYIHSLDVSTGTKNLLINNVSGRKDKIDMSDYGNYGSFEEFDFATKYPGKYSVSKAVGGYDPYSTYLNEMRSIKSDKDADGNTVSGSRKSNIIEYINSLNVDYGAKMILYKSEYPSDDTYNADILDYLNGRGDLSYDDIAAILKELGFTVYADGRVGW